MKMRKSKSITIDAKTGKKIIKSINIDNTPKKKIKSITVDIKELQKIVEYAKKQKWI